MRTGTDTRWRQRSIQSTWLRATLFSIRRTLVYKRSCRLTCPLPITAETSMTVILGLDGIIPMSGAWNSEKTECCMLHRRRVPVTVLTRLLAENTRGRMVYTIPSPVTATAPTHSKRRIEFRIPIVRMESCTELRMRTGTEFSFRIMAACSLKFPRTVRSLLSPTDQEAKSPG
ncbi:hypothetical protein D3C76_167730 [compost metagenome]